MDKLASKCLFELKVISIGFILIEVCESNFLAACDLEAFETAYPGVSVLRSECLSHCEFCRENPFVLVNGEIVSADTTEACLLKIREKIEQELETTDSL